MESKQKEFNKIAEGFIYHNGFIKSVADVKKTEHPANAVFFLDFVEKNNKNEIGEISIVPKEKVVVVNTNSIKTNSNGKLADDLKHYHGIDIKSELHSLLINEASYLIVKETLKKIDNFAEQSYRNTLTFVDKIKEKIVNTLNRLFPFIFKKTFRKTYKINVSADRSANKLVGLILKHINFVAKSNRMTSPKLIIVNNTIFQFLQDYKGFSYVNKNSVNGNDSRIPYFGGTINDSIKIYVNPAMSYKDNCITIVSEPNKTNKTTPSMSVLYLENGSVLEQDNCLKIRKAVVFKGDDKKGYKFFDKFYVKFV